MMPKPLQMRAPTWLSRVPSAIEQHAHSACGASSTGARARVCQSERGNIERAGQEPSSNDYIYFDEIEDLLASLDVVALLAPMVRKSRNRVLFEVKVVINSEALVVSNEDPHRRAFAFVSTDPGMTQESFLELLGRSFAGLNEELQARVPGAIISTSLKIQLAWLRTGQPCLYGGKVHTFDVRAVIDEIAHLENGNSPTKTQQAAPLNGILSGFWHKHFFEPRFIARNLREETEKHFDIFWYRDFLRAKATHPILNASGNVGQLSGLITHAVGLGAFRHRAGLASKQAKPRLTGEWIVFARNNSRNIYLTIATHDEGNESIAIRIWQCACEFPFVDEILRSNGIEITQSTPESSPEA
jgi:hypothetical protein